MKKLLIALVVLGFVTGPGLISTASAKKKATKVFDFVEGDELSTDFLKPNALVVEGLVRGPRVTSAFTNPSRAAPKLSENQVVLGKIYAYYESLPTVPRK